MRQKGRSMMHSLRTRITLVTVCLIVIAVTVVTSLSILFIRNDKRSESDQLLLLLCETGERNLDHYFNSVQNSVEKVSAFVERELEDLSELDDAALSHHMEDVQQYFDEIAYRTDGVLTYYYRIDPAVSDEVKGFWFTNLDGEGFEEHAPTDITLYDTEDTSRLVWFTVPKHEHRAIWLPPYITDNLGMRVISYNVPVYWRGHFIGVAGIEIDYTTMAEQVESIRLYMSGYAFLSNADGALFFHPHVDITKLAEEEIPQAPEGMISDHSFVRYTFEETEKQAVWLPLDNGMRLYVSVPVDETVGEWQTLLWEILIASAVVLLSLSLFTLYYTGRITRPLERLTDAAEQVDNGNYNVTLDYKGDDEVGRLTKTFLNLSNHMKDHIDDLNKRAYVDALTSVKNKGAFSDALDGLQRQMERRGDQFAFGIGVFDCDNLKAINDMYGHDKGDIYLKTACRLICEVFHHSPVFRIGGDEFAVILQREDFENREALAAQFEASKEDINRTAKNPWEEVHVAMGVAVYEPENDGLAIDTVRRADKNMYANKQLRKNGHG